MTSHIAPMHDEMSLIIGAQLHEASRQATEAASVIFYLSGLLSAPLQFLDFVEIAPPHRSGTREKMRKTGAKRKNYF
ncbi:MAG: hypothetical protein WC003_04470 [Terrimicrobiaceae bacterium]